MICDVSSQLNPHEFVSSGWDDTLQFWDARCPNAVRRLPGVLVCGDGIRFDRKGRDLLIASWRPDNQLQVVKYSRNLFPEQISWICACICARFRTSH